MAALVGPGLLLSARLEDDARRILRARGASVRVVAGPVGVLQGRLSRLTLHAAGARVNGATVDRIVLDLRGVIVDSARAFRGELVLRRVARGTAALIISEQTLARYLADGRGIRNAEVRMDDGEVTITGQITLLNALVDVTVRAGLIVPDGHRLLLDVRRLRVSGLEVPADVGNALALSINPILTAPQQPVPLRLTGVAIDAGTARLDAEVAR